MTGVQRVNKIRREFLKEDISVIYIFLIKVDFILQMYL